MSLVEFKIGDKLATEDKDYIYLKASQDYKKGHLVFSETDLTNNNIMTKNHFTKKGLVVVVDEDIKKDDLGWFITKGNCKAHYPG